MQATAITKHNERIAAALVIEATTKELPWRDCECGCSGFRLIFGKEQLLRVYSVRDKTFTLYWGHHVKTRIAGNLSQQEVNALAIWYLRTIYEQAKHEIEAWAEIFA